MGTTHHVAQGDREAAGARGRVREAHKPAPRGCRPLESGWRSKDARAVRRGAIGKVPARATRWWPTLPPVRFGGGDVETYLMATRHVPTRLGCLHASPRLR